MKTPRRLLFTFAMLAGSAPFVVGRAAASDLGFGEYLSGECSTCHRRDGQDKGIPSITGWPKDQFVAVMQSYKSKDRPNPVMQTIAGRLNDQELAALAAYYASLKPN